ncbi:dnaJ homolog subfamily C member 9-like [Anneissia japonica]|uniref:dnaJ homolog subfamily C member 9-like n=1 Tax=Anneissia japonica TaxID=1529436 RepID=UPI0014256863|nr:dnaJ homolog subfamily C member 9-like [Anneissia japonica]
MGLIDDCEEHFNERNLYSILGVEESVKPDQIKKAYHKCSLKVHPDRVCEDKESATKKFQTLGKIYAVLSDKGKRALYDESGEIDDEIDMEQDRDWIDYWRLLFPKLTVNDIEKYEETYRGSPEELDELKSAYLKFRGDMEQILKNVMCCTYTDEPRFRKLLQELIAKGELEEFENFTTEDKQKVKKRKKKAMAEEKEAEKVMKDLKVKNGDDALMAMIQKRQASRQQGADNFFAQLEAKYAKPKSKAGGKKKKK